MLERTIYVVRITQILKDEGWDFIDEGNTIRAVVHTGMREHIDFATDAEFFNWLGKKALEYDME